MLPEDKTLGFRQIPDFLGYEHHVTWTRNVPRLVALTALCHIFLLIVELSVGFRINFVHLSLQEVRERPSALCEKLVDQLSLCSCCLPTLPGQHSGVTAVSPRLSPWRPQDPGTILEAHLTQRLPVLPGRTRKKLSRNMCVDTRPYVCVYMRVCKIGTVSANSTHP